MRKILVSVVLALVLVVSAAVPAFAADTDTVTVSATPAIISIANAPTAWTMNDSTATVTPGDDVIRKATTYWSNDLGNTTSPTATVAADECRFTVTNDGTVPVDIEISMSSFVGGDAMVNGDGGTAGAGAGVFGAEVYLVGAAIADAVNITIAGTADVIANLPDTTGNTKKWGLEILTQSDDFTDATQQDSAVVLTATEYTG